MLAAFVPVDMIYDRDPSFLETRRMAWRLWIGATPDRNCMWAFVMGSSAVVHIRSRLYLADDPRDLVRCLWYSSLLCTL